MTPEPIQGNLYDKQADRRRLVAGIPEGASLHDIAREIDFVAAVRHGLDELDRGESFSLDDVERELPSWVIK